MAEDLFAFKGYCMGCGEELEPDEENLQGDCIKCGNMCCYICGVMTEEGLLCEDCKPKDDGEEG